MIYIGILIGLLVGLIVGMIIEGALVQKYVVNAIISKIPSSDQLINALLDAPAPTLSSGVQTQTSHILEEYKIEYINPQGNEEIKYSGYNSDLAFQEWIELERNPEKYPGTINYYRNNKIHSTKVQ